jgi:hypothetical protein
MSDIADRVAQLQKTLGLPKSAPIPGAMYRCQRVTGTDFITIVALELHDKGRWSAVAMSVRFGESRISSDNNRFERHYEIYTLPNIVPAEEDPDIEACIDLAIMEAHA